MPYEIRYCAFVDILGFSGLIDALDAGSFFHDDLRDLLNTVHTPAPAFLALHEGHDLRAQSISDAVCLSASVSGAGLSHMFFSLEMLTIELLKKGFFVRGAIVRDKLFHDDRIVFGPALVKAYRIETSIARYPRIVIRSDVRNDAAKYEGDVPSFGPMLDYIQQAEDGPYFFHPLRILKFLIKAQEPTIAEYNEIASQIQKRFDAAVDNPHHFEKVQWFARYWNKTVGQRQGVVAKIRGPSVSPEGAMWA
jgi:hypothetical protein